MQYQIYLTPDKAKPVRYKNRNYTRTQGTIYNFVIRKLNIRTHHEQIHKTPAFPVTDSHILHCR